MTAPLLPPVEQRSTAAERLRDSIRRSRAASWLIPLLLTVFAGILRLTNLGHPGTLAFDETYYVKDAWSLWTLGYEGTWGSGANEMFADGDTSALTATGSFVVHPPLGKWIIALGMGLLGPGSSVGWRLTTALIGTATVLLLYLVTRTLTRSTTLATLAGLFLAVDGLSIVMSRIALLDATLTFFILLGFWFILLDRRVSPGPGQLGLFEPFNEHWSTVPILIFRAFMSVFGVREYWPYVLLLVVGHLLTRKRRREALAG